MQFLENTFTTLRISKTKETRDARDKYIDYYFQDSDGRVGWRLMKAVVEQIRAKKAR